VLEVLLFIAGDEHAKSRDRIAASALILDRAFGKPQQFDDDVIHDPASASARLVALISPELKARLGVPREMEQTKVPSLTTAA
jgi:hypothetical protein